MWSTVVGFAVLCGLASVLAAPTVHLVKQEDSEAVPDYQQLLPTDLPPIVDPVWMTMKPLVKTTFVEPLNPQYPQPPSTEQRPVVQPTDVTPYQQPNAPTWPVPARRNPPVTSYYPFYYETQTEGPSTRQFYPPQPHVQYPLNVQPQYQYHYQSYPQLTWKSAAPQPCANAAGGIQQAYHHHHQYQQRGY